jgi:hypothetical protein
MFSNRGEEQFVPHETMAVEHFAEILFAPGGKSFERNECWVKMKKKYLKFKKCHGK